MIQRKSEEKKSHIQKELENLLPSKIMCLKNVPRSLRWRSTSNPFTTGTGLGANVGGRVVSECLKTSASFFLSFFFLRNSLWLRSLHSRQLEKHCRERGLVPHLLVFDVRRKAGAAPLRAADGGQASECEQRARTAQH